MLKYRRHPYQVSVYRCRRQALSNLAARVAAWSKRTGNLDPLDSIEGITPALLSELGVSENVQEATVAKAYLVSIASMYRGSWYSVARNMMSEMLRASEWKHAQNPVVADCALLSARLFWREERFVMSILTAGYAIAIRPKVLGRPLKLLLRSLRLAAGVAHHPIAEQKR